MASIGDTLREQRLRRNLTVDEVAERLRINARLLEALEAEDFDKLPGRFFARSFLRQYAAFLGVDAAVVEAALAQLEEAAEPQPAEPPPEAARIEVAPIIPGLGTRREGLRRWLGSIAALALAVVACAVLYTLWQRFHTTLPPAAAPPAPAAPAPAAAPSPAGTAPSSASPAAPIALEIRATEEVWIRVTADGKVAFAGTLRPGQSRAFQGQANMNLLTGNAGGLEPVFNGKPLGPLGPRGQIRVLELTPAEHRILERKPPPAPSPAPDAAARGAAGA